MASEGAISHAMARRNRRRRIVLDDEDCQRLLEDLRRAAERCGAALGHELPSHGGEAGINAALSGDPFGFTAAHRFLAEMLSDLAELPLRLVAGRRSLLAA